MHDDIKKDTNPKDIIGMKKAPISTLSCAVLYEMGLGMLEGARKYGRHNYRVLGVSATIYYDAAMGHLMDWWEGEDIDPDSGLSHVIKAMTALAVLRDSMLMGNWIDDRPLRNPNKLYKKYFNPKAQEIIKKYPDYVVSFLEKDKKKFVCPAGWVVQHNPQGPFRAGWYIHNRNTFTCLHKDLTLHEHTGIGSYEYGEAPGYWPTKEEAEVALVAYLEKTK